MEPTLAPNNRSCPAGSTELKIEPVTDGSFSDGTLTVTLDVRDTAQGQVFDWETDSPVTILQVIVKGGPDANVYDYAGAGVFVHEDDGLHAPLNPNNNKFFGLSHISFCYTPGEASIDVSKSCAEQTVQAGTVTTRNNVVITNDGDFPLSDIVLKETIMNLSCSITKVDGVATSTPLPTDVFVPVPTVGSFTGDLAVGESVNLEVTCFDGALNIANTVVAQGTSDFGNVQDMDTSDPEKECPFPPSPMVDITKDCPNVNDVHLVSVPLDGTMVLAVEVCTTITVTNTDPHETLSSAVVTDTNIEALAAGVEVGPLAPGETVDVGEFLGHDLCYLPSAPQQMPIDTDQYSTCVASFLNTATVEAVGLFGGEAMDQDSTGAGECELCPASCPLPDP